MKNLDQIRAKAALESAKNLDASAINGLPALILNNGLLSAAAFCHADSDGENRKQLKKAMIAIIEYLADRKVITLNTIDIKIFIKELSSRNPIDLQRATTESLAYLGYLKRFAQKKEKE